jgi:hypothetical protein
VSSPKSTGEGCILSGSQLAPPYDFHPLCKDLQLVYNVSADVSAIRLSIGETSHVNLLFA